MTTTNNPGCLTLLFNALGLTPKNKAEPITLHLEADSDIDEYPYRLRDDFLSQAEVSFYHVLKSMMADKLLIFSKVSLADIFYVTRPHENRGARNKIDRKHVDFVVCDPKTLKPLFAIELDDSSHQREDRVERDEFVDEVFKAAELPLVHVPASLTYNTSELGVLFGQALKQKQNRATNVASKLAAQPVLEITEPSRPVCPKCGVLMVVRTAAQGNNAGKKFYGCPNYPKCRVVIPIG